MAVRTFDRLREALPDSVELVPAGGASSGCASARTPTRSRASAPRPSWPTRRCSGRWTTVSPGAASAPSRSRSSRRCAASAPNGRASTRSSRTARTARCRTRCRATSRSPPNCLVTIDWGAQLDGYCSDCTRTFAVGEPGERAREVYELVLHAQLAGLDAVRAGVTGRDADAAARELIARGRLRRALRPRPRARRRLGDPRGAAPVENVGRDARRRPRRDGRAGRLPAGRAGRADRGPRARDRRRLRAAQRPAEASAPST